MRWGVASSMLSKLSSALLQFLSIPLAARTLGKEDFGLFATVAMLIFGAVLLQLGVGPAMGRVLAEASSKNDKVQEARVYQIGALLVIAAGIAGGTVILLTIHLVPLHFLFGHDFIGRENVMIPALITGVFILTAEMMLTHTDRAREGYMEAWISNSWGAVGNFLAAIAVAVGIRHQPSVPFLLVAVFGPTVLVRVINTIHLCRKRSYLVKFRAQFSASDVRLLIRDGLAFTMAEFLVYQIEVGLCVLLLARLSGPSGVALFQVFVPITTAFNGLLSMVGNPLWASIVDAKARNDGAWILRHVRRFQCYAIALAAFVGGWLVLLGPWILPRWYGGEFQADRLLFVGYASYLLFNGWRLANYFVCIGLGLIRKAGPISLAGSILGFMLAGAGLKLFSEWALFAGLAFGLLIGPGWYLPRVVRRAGRMIFPVEEDKPAQIPQQGAENESSVRQRSCAALRRLIREAWLATR